MYLMNFNHDDFDKYAEDQVNSVLNIALVLRYLAKDALTIAELSRRINTPEREEQKRSKYDLYTLIAKMIKWGYVKKEQNAKKYKSTLEHCFLTRPGQELLALMPKYLIQGEQEYHNAYLDYIAFLRVLVILEEHGEHLLPGT